MADKVKITLNHASIAALLKSPAIQANLAARASRIAATATNNAGPGAVFGHSVNIGPNRARAGVWTQNAAAMRAEATSRALTRAIDAGRG